MNKMLFCVTSNKSPIGDGFVELVRNMYESDDSFVEKYSIAVGPGLKDEFNDIDDSSIFRFKVNNENKWSFLNIFEWIRYYLFCKKRSCRALFLYSNSPIAFLACMFSGVRRNLYFWEHDPVYHPCESRFNRIFKSIDKSILFIFFRPEVFVASTYLRDIVKEKNFIARRFALEVSVIPFPYISSLVPSEGEFNEDRKIDVLFFGRAEPYKGLNSLKAALAELAFSGAGLCVNVIGRGASVYGLESVGCINVTVVDEYVSDEYLKKKISNSKVCVFPYTSGTGTQTIPTALASGCAVVCSDLECFSQYSKYFPAVYLVDTSNSVLFAESIMKAINADVDQGFFLEKFSVEKFGKSVGDKVSGGVA